jgi:hypothetical protein
MKITMAFWDGAETENIPLEDRESTIRAHALFKLLIKRRNETNRQDTTQWLFVTEIYSSWIS